MTGPSYRSTIDSNARQPSPLGEHELAVLRVLVENTGRVVGRLELARRAGLAQLGERRTDSLLVGIRRVLGATSIRTVRGRGWMLESTAVSKAEELLPD